jgi:hypothetical protein
MKAMQMLVALAALAVPASAQFFMQQGANFPM